MGEPAVNAGLETLMGSGRARSARGWPPDEHATSPVRPSTSSHRMGHSLTRVRPGAGKAKVVDGGDGRHAGPDRARQGGPGRDPPEIPTRKDHRLSPATTRQSRAGAVGHPGSTANRMAEQIDFASSGTP